MKKRIKIILIIGLLVIISFLIIEYKNYKNKQNKEFLLNSTINCMKVCESTYNKDKNSLGEEKAITPNYFYNIKTGDCYYSGGIEYLQKINSEFIDVVFRHIKNCSTGEVLLYFSTIEDTNYKNCTIAKECAYTLDDYIKKEKEIMKINYQED